MNSETYCGYIAIVGRPNVGKSTLLNKILGQKISITAHRPQTTRHNILGIKTIGQTQAIYVDTPGLYRGKQSALNRQLFKAALSALAEVDAVIFVVDGTKWGEEDEWILQKIKQTPRPIILAINKADKIKNKDELLPHIQKISSKMKFVEVIPLSAKTGVNIAALELSIEKLLPENPFYYAEDQLTDKNERFLVAEIIREKLTRMLGNELPYALAVEIESFTTKNNIIHIAAMIYVEKDGQKVIIIGKKGEKLKEIGTKARKDIEHLLGSKIYLQLWVKVKRGWTKDERMLQQFGY